MLLGLCSLSFVPDSQQTTFKTFLNLNAYLGRHDVKRKRPIMCSNTTEHSAISNLYYLKQNVQRCKDASSYALITTFSRLAMANIHNSYDQIPCGIGLLQLVDLMHTVLTFTYMQALWRF